MFIHMAALNTRLFQIRFVKSRDPCRIPIYVCFVRVFEVTPVVECVCFFYAFA